MVDEDEVKMDDIASLNNPDDQNIRVITWDLVKEETATDETMRLLSTMIESSSFPDSKCDLPVQLAPYWSIRNNLHVADGVVMMRDMVVVPQSLRDDIVHSYDEGAGSRVVIPSSLRIEILQSQIVVIGFKINLEGFRRNGTRAALFLKSKQMINKRCELMDLAGSHSETTGFYAICTSHFESKVHSSCSLFLYHKSCK